MKKRYVYVVLSSHNNYVFYNAFNDFRGAKDEEFNIIGCRALEFIGIVRVRAYAPVITIDSACFSQQDIMIRLHAGGFCEYDSYVLCNKKDLARARNLKKGKDFELYPLKNQWGDMYNDYRL